MTTLPDEIRRELAPLEQVLWSGRPKQGLVLRGSDAFQIPFSLLWCGFALFWETGVARTGNAFFMLWGVPFVAIGLYMVFGRFFFDARQRARTFYAVTGQRVLIVSGVFARSIKSLDLKGLAALTLSEGRDGRGSIVFGPDAGMFGGSSSWPGSRAQVAPRFDLIEDARRVHDIIRGASAR
jgi:hypothetical protein